MTKSKVTITTVWGTVLWESEKETVGEAALEKYGRDANLRGADLRGANLYGANLRGADLRGANLYGTNLRDADLYGSNLRDADLRGANLYGTNLRDADLRGANLRGADLRGANLYGTNLRDADLYGSNLYGTPLSKLPQDFINQCSRDILFILGCLKAEVPYLRQALLDGKVDGSQYEGDCACLIGTLGKADGGTNKVCTAIPFYEKGTHNYGEMWFLNIKEGDTPKNNEFAAHALKLCDMVLNGSLSAPK
jgi:hypothetical protein